MSAAATSLGSILRQERLRKDLSLAVIASNTRICARILEAIEEDRFDGVPGGAYRRHFVRQYACALGMDGEAAVAEYRNQHEELPVPLPVPRKTKRSRVWADLAWAMAGAAGLVFSYHFLHTRRAGLIFPELGASTIQTAPSTGQAERMIAGPPLPTQTAPPPATTPPPLPPPPVHVAFTATERVWMHVKCDGTASYSGVLDVPQSRTFEAAGTVTALVGNAGGLLIWLNGKPLGALGAHGKVEMVELTLNGVRRIARQALSERDPNSIPQL